MNSQNIYISCSRDVNADTCNRDTLLKSEHTKKAVRKNYHRINPRATSKILHLRIGWEFYTVFFWQDSMEYIWLRSMFHTRCFFLSFLHSFTHLSFGYFIYVLSSFHQCFFFWLANFVHSTHSTTHTSSRTHSVWFSIHLKKFNGKLPGSDKLCVYFIMRKKTEAMNK